MSNNDTQHGENLKTVLTTLYLESTRKGAGLKQPGTDPEKALAKVIVNADHFDFISLHHVTSLGIIGKRT